jgi:hypothetical protein
MALLLITDGREVAAGVCHDIHRVQSSKRHQEVLELDVCRVGTGEHVTRFSASCDETVHQLSHNAAFSGHDVAFYHAGADGVQALRPDTSVYEIDVNSGDTILVRMEPKKWGVGYWLKQIDRSFAFFERGDVVRRGTGKSCFLDRALVFPCAQRTLDSHHREKTLSSCFLLPEKFHHAAAPREDAVVKSTYSLQTGEAVAVWWVKPQWDACE